MPDPIEHLWTIACRAVTHEGGLTLHGLMDMIAIGQILPQQPVLLQFPCVIASQWRRNSGPGLMLTERIMLQHPDGSLVQVTQPHVINLTTRHLFCALARVHSIPLRGNGQYWFVSQRQNEETGNWERVDPTAGLWIPLPNDWPLPPGV